MPVFQPWYFIVVELRRLTQLFGARDLRNAGVGTFVVLGGLALASVAAVIVGAFEV